MSSIKTAVWLGGLVLVVALAPARAQTTKVGVFNAQAVSENTAVGKQIQADLVAFTERKEGEIGERQQRVSEMRKQLSEQSLSLSSERRAELEKDIQRHALELQSFQESASRELELEYATATRAFQEKLIAVVETFGRDEGFSLILDRSQVAWADAGIDVTSAIVDHFNRMYPVEAGGE